MRVLVTRPEPDASAFARELITAGHEPVICPLMNIDLTGEPAPSGINEAVLLFTSANGVRAAAARGLKPVHGVFAIGAATARAAEEAGFAVAGIAGGDVVSLAKLVQDDLPTEQQLVHIAGSDLAGDLKDPLARAGYRITRWTAYAAVALGEFPRAGADFLRGEAGAVALFSPRTSKLLRELVVKAGLSATASKHVAACLSPAVAAAAAMLPWRELRIAARNEQSALIALLN